MVVKKLVLLADGGPTIQNIEYERTTDIPNTSSSAVTKTQAAMPQGSLGMQTLWVVKTGGRVLLLVLSE